MRFTATVSFLLALSLFCVFVACKDVNGVGSDAASVPTTDAPVLTGSEPQKFEFQAEVNRMMKLLIHSLYKVKDIFLRELISNASDALDKLRFISLTKPEILGTVRDLNITVRADKEAKTLTITDTGIGMTKNDLIKNLGTIAKSGTAEFLAALEKDKSDVGLIGQFGVGFYSGLSFYPWIAKIVAFLVADMVTVTSKHNNDSQFIWSSHAETDFTINADPRGNTLGRGTQVVLHIKEGNEEFLEQESLEDIIRRYSEFINFPIYLLKDKTEEVEVPLSDDEVKDEALKRMAEKKQSTESSDGESPDADSEALVEDDNSPVKPIKTTKKEERKFQSWELMNPNKPIWTRDPKNVTEEEYNTFYKGLYRETSDPLGYMHFKAEGDMEFRSILYIPEKAPQGLLQNSERSLRNIKLFVRRVFITDELIEFIPKYLSFLKGIVDSDDLPLNVSRETLQQHKILRQIKKKVIRKALELVKALSEDVEKYGKFMEEYGVFLKLGVIEDVKNRKKLLKLLRFSTSYQSIDASNIAVSNKTSLDDYVKRMKKGQKQIFVLTGSSVEELENSVFSEKAVARGYEVLYFSEPIDEYIIQNVHDFQEKRFQNLAKDGFEFGDEDEVSKERVKSLNEEFTPLADWLKRVLASHVDKVGVVANV